MTLKILSEMFCVSKVEGTEGIDLSVPYTFLSVTEEEISLVCPEQNVPEGIIECEEGWRAFKIEGVLDFSLVGIMAKLAGLLAEAGISIFAVSTYNTDYIFVKEERFEQAENVFKKDGFTVKA